MSFIARRVLLALFILLVVPLHADQQRPQFQSGIDLVTLDLTAIGPDGWPVRDLRSEEVTVTVNGRVRPLKSFEYVEVAPRELQTAAARPSAYATNRSGQIGRSVFIVVLHEHIRPGNERVAMSGVARLIDQLSPSDRVALLTMPFGRVEVDLTTDHERLKQRLPQIVGHATDAVPLGRNTTDERGELLAFLKDISRLEGPKTVVLISEGYDAGDTHPGSRDLRGEGGSAPLDAGMTTLIESVGLQSAVSDVTTAASAARAQFFVIQPLNLDAVSGTSERMPGVGAPRNRDPTARSERGESEFERRLGTRAGQTNALRTLALATRGQFFELSGDASPIFDRIVRESSGYYEIAFESEPEEKKGRNREVKVQTSRPGVTLRARRTFTETAPAAATPASARAMLTDARWYRDVPVRATSYTVRAPNGDVRIIALADAPGRTVKEAGVALLDEKNIVTAAWPAELSESGEPVLATRVVAPGSYRMRVAVVDSDGRGGAVDFSFTAQLATLGTMSAGSLMLGRNPSGSLKPQLVFSPGGEVQAYFELYGDTAGVAISFDVKGARGETLRRIAGEITPTSETDRWIVSGAIPIEGLTPGEYLVRAVVTTAGGDAGVLSATLQIADVKPEV